MKCMTTPFDPTNQLRLAEIEHAHRRRLADNERLRRRFRRSAARRPDVR